MSKKILILSRRDDRDNYDNRTTMLQGLASVRTDNKYDSADYEDLLFRYDGQRLTIIDSVGGNDIADYDALFLIGWFKTKALDDIARAAAHYAHAKGIPFSNSEAYHGRSFTKLSQCVIAALNGVSVTPFVFSMNQEVLLSAARTMEYPYIAKAIAASRGDSNYLIHSHQELETAVREPSDTPRFFIVQQFIPNDGDYRILVMGDKVRLVIHRQATGDSHLNNTSQGGTATLTAIEDVPPQVIEDATRLARLFRREVTGVDMVCHRDSGRFYFLEANNMPQLATGSNVPHKMQQLADYLSELADGTAVSYID